jgi:ABC-type nitrate/sulfonate/bicarbonate transport system permease component
MFLTVFFLVKHVLPVKMTPVRFVVIFLGGLLLASINASGEALLTGASDTGEIIQHLVGVTPPVAWIPISTTLHHGNGEEPKLFNI